MKTPLLSVILLSLLAIPNAFAGNAAVNFSNGTAIFTNSLGVALPTGSLVRVGTFDESGGNRSILDSSTDFDMVNALFTPLAEGILNAGTVTQALNPLVPTNFTVNVPGGQAVGSIADWTTTYMAAGTQLYLWVFNSGAAASGDTGAVENSDYQAATEWGIYTNPDSNLWELPDPGSLQNASLLGNSVTDSIFGSTDNSGSPAEVRTAQLVPEPSRAILALLGFSVCALRRRR